MAQTAAIGVGIVMVRCRALHVMGTGWCGYDRSVDGALVAQDSTAASKALVRTAAQPKEMRKASFE
jgi:hypothetical protein